MGKQCILLDYSNYNEKIIAALSAYYPFSVLVSESEKCIIIDTSNKDPELDCDKDIYSVIKEVTGYDAGIMINVEVKYRIRPILSEKEDEKFVSRFTFGDIVKECSSYEHASWEMKNKYLSRKGEIEYGIVKEYFIDDDQYDDDSDDFKLDGTILFQKLLERGLPFSKSRNFCSEK